MVLPNDTLNSVRINREMINSMFIIEMLETSMLALEESVDDVEEGITALHKHSMVYRRHTYDSIF